MDGEEVNDEDNIDNLDFDKKDYDITELVVDYPRAVQSVIKDIDRLIS